MGPPGFEPESRESKSQSLDHASRRPRFSLPSREFTRCCNLVRLWWTRISYKTLVFPIMLVSWNKSVHNCLDRSIQTLTRLIVFFTFQLTLPQRCNFQVSSCYRFLCIAQRMFVLSLCSCDLRFSLCCIDFVLWYSRKALQCRKVWHEFSRIWGCHEFGLNFSCGNEKLRFLRLLIALEILFCLSSVNWRACP